KAALLIAAPPAVSSSARRLRHGTSTSIVSAELTRSGEATKDHTGRTAAGTAGAAPSVVYSPGRVSWLEEA
ncbi:MAG: hypothetical protein CVU63_07175, partial [Deltaproteobacteria bacterium HGW-Deltaproteobacteria-20]